MTWSKCTVEWTEGDTAFLSVVFTWDLPKAYMRAVWYREQGYEVRAGGPACLLQPDYLADIAEVNGPAVAALHRHNPDATVTSRGCIRKCSFCAVPKIEGELVELDGWQAKPIVCDNNLLACSQAHFDRVIDSLRGVKGVDFNQGLDARLLTDYHAERLAEVDLAKLRLAWDATPSEKSVFDALNRLRKAGIPKALVTVYVLIGWRDDPEDARYRLETLWTKGYMPFPMRYQPLDALRKNAYTGPGWDNSTLREYMRYWANLVHTAGVPFDEWLDRKGRVCAGGRSGDGGGGMMGKEPEIMTVEYIKEQVLLIETKASDDSCELAHLAEDYLHQEVLKAIEAGAPNPGELASEALKTLCIEFERWYA